MAHDVFLPFGFYSRFETDSELQANPRNLPVLREAAVEGGNSVIASVVAGVIACVLASQQLSSQILPHQSGRAFRGHARENLNRGFLKQRVSTPTHASGNDEVDASLLQPWRQQPRMVFRRLYLGRRGDFLCGWIDVHQCKLLTMPEMLGKPSVRHGNGNSHMSVFLSMRDHRISVNECRSFWTARSTARQERQRKRAVAVSSTENPESSRSREGWIVTNPAKDVAALRRRALHRD
jgi:hypothetical protein